MIEPVSEDAVLITMAEAIDDTLPARIARLSQSLRDAKLPWLQDLIPSYTTLLVVYDPVLADFRDVTSRLKTIMGTEAPQTDIKQPPTGELVELPVYYSTESGPDLAWLAAQTGLDMLDIIRRHTAIEYQVHALGFAPGFAFMGEVDPAIAQPRKQTPRKQVPAGSVGIANRQTAVYPQASPGGWQIIGCCPTPLFDPETLSLLRVGDRVRFRAISRQGFLAAGGKLTETRLL